MGGGPTTPVEQITELGEGILEKLIAAGITTVEELADMTPEQLEEIPGIGEKTLEKISVAVRHYFGQYEEGEERPVVVVPEVNASSAEEHLIDETTAAAAGLESSMEKTPEEMLVADARTAGVVEEIHGVSTEEIADAEEAGSESDAFSDADAREEAIELDNDAVDSLVNESQEVSGEGIDEDGSSRG
jgi:N utilization substance protein A